MKRLAMLLFLGLCSFLGGLAAVSLGLAHTPFATAQQGRYLSEEVGSPLRAMGDRFHWVAARAKPTVVAIEASRPASPGAKTKMLEEAGSGVLVRFPGHAGLFVVTNNHVIQHATPAQITVWLADNRLVKPSKVLADPETDIALLQLEGVEGLTAARLGDSDSLEIGHWVLAIGSPFGLNQTVTQGILSARGRGQISLGSTIRIKDFLQTDAAINPGSSGGPLLNLDGEVVGINTAIASNSGSNSGVAFSIPINLVKRIAKQLLEKGEVTRGYLGLQVAGVFEASDAERLGLNRAQGALVERVYADTPAQRAGLRADDVLLEVDGTLIRNENHFINLISDLTSGQRIRIHLWRNRRSYSVEAVIGDWSAAQSQFRALR